MSKFCGNVILPWGLGRSRKRSIERDTSRFMRTDEDREPFEELLGWSDFTIPCFIQKTEALSELVSVLFPAVQKPSLQRLLTVSPVGIWVVKLSTSPQDECFKKA